MPTEAEVKVALDRVTSQIRDLHDEVLEESVEDIVSYKSDDGEEIYDFIGIRCAREDDRYIIAAHPQFEYMVVLSFSSITSYLASGITTEEAAEILDTEDEGDDDPSWVAAKQLLDNVDDDTMSALKSYLQSMIGGSAYTTDIETTSNDSVSYISISAKIFPYEDGLSLEGLDDGIRPVVNAGKRLERLLPRTIALIPPDEEQEEYSLQIHFGW